jgi:hypothetical protein
MSLKINGEQGLVGKQGWSSVLGSAAQSGLADTKQGIKDFDAKYSISQGMNRLWKPEADATSGVRVAQVVTGAAAAAKLAKEVFDKGIEKQKEKLERIEKQNKETNQNVEHINRELDRISREMKEKADKGPKK